MYMIIIPEKDIINNGINKKIKYRNNIMFKSQLKGYELFNLQQIVNRIQVKWNTVVAKEGDFADSEFAQNYKTTKKMENISINEEKSPMDYNLIDDSKRENDDLGLQNL